MTRPEDITLTADDTKCVRCGRGFDPGEGHYGTSTVPGHFHSACLYHLDPPSYRAGLLAGLREAIEVINTSLTRGSAAANIRARIAELEEEAGRK